MPIPIIPLHSDAQCVFFIIRFFWCLWVFFPLFLAAAVVVVVIVVFFYQTKWQTTRNGIESTSRLERASDWEQEWRWKETKRWAAERNNNNHSWNIFPFLLFFSSSSRVHRTHTCPLFLLWCFIASAATAATFATDVVIFCFNISYFLCKNVPLHPPEQKHLIPRKNQIKAL